MNIHARKEFKGLVWTKENIAIAAKMWSEGYSSVHIAKHFGVTCNSLCGIASRNRDLFPRKLGTLAIPQTRQGAKWDKAKIDECLRLRKAGKTAKAVSEILGMPKNSVEHVIRKHRALFEVAPPAAPVSMPTVRPERNRIHSFGIRSVERHHVSGEVHSMPRVSILNGKEG